jgi:hypothetical protein
MADWLRRAGWGKLADGSVVTWTVAEGGRGRRWREVRTAGEGIVSSLLLETAPDRRFAHLELSTAAGLLTLHPEGDGTLHGNAVTAAGVAHVVAEPWPEGSVLLVEGSAIGDAAGAWQAGAVVRGDPAQPTTMVGLDLSVRASTAASNRLAALYLDADGLPLPPDGRSWPLEIEAN